MISHTMSGTRMMRINVSALGIFTKFQNSKLAAHQTPAQAVALRSSRFLTAWPGPDALAHMDGPNPGDIGLNL
jgi:hypothetical protein